MKAVIFAGGVGTRLWPLSRKKSPKQFEKIINNSSMLQLAVERLHPNFKNEDIYIATGGKYQKVVSEQLPDIPKENMLLEPEMRDVGPAVGLIAAIFAKRSPNEPIAILWGSDHLVKEDQLFRDVLEKAAQVIKENGDRIVFIGQKPRFANQNLGWLEFGNVIKKIGGVNLYEFKELKYRPELETAKKFFLDGHHAWNLGYFVTTPQFLWDSFKEFAPAIYGKLLQIHEVVDTDKFQDVLAEVYPTIDKISFDDAVLEKIDISKAYVISENLGWSDVGAWEAFKEAFETYPLENVIRGKVVAKDSEDSLIYNYEDKKLVVCIDIDSAIVVNTPDVLLITLKTSVPKIKKLVESFQGTENEDYT